MTRGPSALPAKVVRPPCPGAFPRSRLFRLLDRARRKPVVWVSGPAGSGKTTLVSSYVAARGIPCLWYRADGGDADVSTLFHYLGVAARAASRRAEAPLPNPASEIRFEPRTFAQRYFEALWGRLRKPSFVVFDDLQEVPEGSILFEVLRDAAERIPRGITLFSIGRSEPPPPFARLRARDAMARIGWGDLRLTPSETKRLGGRRGMKGAGRDEWRRLHDLTDGWAAGVVLALQAAEGGRRDHVLSGGGAPGEIFDFFAEEILSRFNARRRRLLLAASFLPETTPSLAEEATGLKGAGPALSALARQNAFVERRPGAETTYRFHSLFRGFLMARARETLAPGRVAGLKRSAAAALEGRGRFEEAAALLRDADDRAGLARLVRDRAPLLYGQGRIRTVEEWLRGLPEAELEADPWLLYWRGRVRLPYEPEGGRRDFEKSFREFVARREASGAFLAWSGTVEAILLGAEGLKPLDLWLPVLDGLIESFGDFPDKAVRSRATVTMLKALSLRRPPLSSAKEWAERAIAVAQDAEDVPLRLEALSNLAYYWYHGGDFQRTGTVLTSLREQAARPESGPLSRLTVAWIEAAHANMSALYDRCLEAVDSGLKLASGTGIHVMDFLLMGHGALAALHKRDERTASRYLRTMAASLGSARPWEEAFYRFVAGWEALGRKDVALARQHADASLALGEKIGNPWTAALAHLQQAFVLRKAGETGASDRHLLAARRLGTRHGLEFVRFAALLADAFFGLEDRRDEKALRCLREGMRTGREKGFMGIFVWRPGFLERILTKAIESGIEVDYARGLVRKNAVLPDGERQDLESWPWPVRIFSLGRLEIQREGLPVAYSRKVPRKPLLLLKALIALGGRDVPEGRLIDLLWPDSEGDMAVQAFRTNVVRLRKILGDDETLTMREGRLSLNGRRCRLDAWALERVFRRAEEIAGGANAGPDEDPARLAERAVDLYRGPFLPRDRDRPWTAHPRQRLRKQFARILLLAGDRLEQRGEREAAASLYLKGLDSDEQAEEIGRRLMACYARLGRPEEASKILRRCREATCDAPGNGQSP